MGDGGPAVRAAARTDVGRARERNEDAFFAGRRVFAVADGLGGHRAGEVASRLALEPLEPLEGAAPEAAAGSLTEAIRHGNRAIYDRAQEDASLRGMGTTITAVAVGDGTVHMAHVGDSRCYLLRAGQITQLSQDHTLVARMMEQGKLTAEQAEAHPQRSVLTRALGAEPDVEVDEIDVSVIPGDRLVLCSDGLTTVVSDEEITRLAGEGADLDAICERLVDEANERGGPDNITVVLVEIGGDSIGPAPGRGVLPFLRRRSRTRGPRLRRRRLPHRPLLWAAIVLAVLAGGFAGVRAWADRSFYVGVAEDRVAIYRGFPLEVFGVHFSRVEAVTDTRLADVAPYFRPRLEEGIRAGSLAEAQRIAARQVPRAGGPAPGPATPQPSPGGTP